MRTLATQMRLRRLLRVQAEYHQRLVTEGATRALASAASARLLQLLQDTRGTWTRESQGTELAGLRSHVLRSFAAMEAAAAALPQPRADWFRLGTEFREAGVPLVFFLRGLDDSEGPVVAELAGKSLARSA